MRLPHDVHLKCDFSIASIHNWKAKQTRLFMLDIGLPLLIQHLPKKISSYFSIYSIFVKIVHCPIDFEEIQLADQLISYYCGTSSEVYDSKIELYSLHAHLHLPNQVLSKSEKC